MHLKRAPNSLAARIQELTGVATVQAYADDIRTTLYNTQSLVRAASYQGLANTPSLEQPAAAATTEVTAATEAGYTSFQQYMSAKRNGPNTATNVTDFTTQLPGFNVPR